MKGTYDSMSIVTSSDYWWREAKDKYEDAMRLLKAGGTRKCVLNLCHGAIERALKAILAQKGLLSDKDRSHPLWHLAAKAGIKDELDEELRSYLTKASTLHSRTSYPDENEHLSPWSNDLYYSEILAGTAKMYRYLLSLRCDHGGPACEDGGNGRR